MFQRLPAGVLLPLLAVYMPTCSPPQIRPTEEAARTPMAELWEAPRDVPGQDLFYGQWGRDHAPDPLDTYTFVKPKLSGVNPGMTVRDSNGRKWSVKQPPHDDRGAEGPIEVVLSRVLSAIGYHQPPVYYLLSFTLADPFGQRMEPGGRFRLDHEALKERGEWSWHENPFVGTRPYQGLLVVLLMFNSSDLKNANNTLYEYRRSPGRVERWFVVRDLGTALGSTGRFRPRRGDVAAFEQHGFITGVENGFVAFEYRGFHQELARGRITPADVVWACALLDRLTLHQWREAFRAGGYDPATSDRFIRRLRGKIDQGRQLARAH